MKITSKAGSPTYSITDMTEEQAVALAVVLGAASGHAASDCYEIYSKLDDELNLMGWSRTARVQKYNKKY